MAIKSGYQLKPSKIPLMIIILVLILGILAIDKFPQFRLIVWLIISLISLIWLYKYLTFKNYIFIVDKYSQTLEIKYKNKNQIAKLISIKFISWWLIRLEVSTINSKTLIFPVFIDSLPLDQYKLLRMIALWR